MTGHPQDRGERTGDNRTSEGLRPFRHLCPEADARDAMTDDEFWAHVARSLAGPDDPEPDNLATWERHLGRRAVC